MNQNIIQDKSKRRDSNVEVFRLLATFLVLLIHFNGWFVGGLSDLTDSSKDLSFRVGQMVIGSLSVVCVNCFLIISGWYGIKLKFQSLWKMYVLLVCIYVPFQVITSLYTGEFSVVAFGDNLLAFTRESYFVQCYLMLVFLSPLINSFFEKYGRKTLGFVLAFWAIEIVMENLRGNKSLGFADGYSLIHFALIYMMARTASLYKEEILKVSRKTWIAGYFICASLLCVGHWVSFKHTWDYSNPVVVLQSFCLFFPFLYKTFYNKWINWLAGSAFAVFIIHTTSPVYNVLVNIDNWLLNHLDYWAYLPSYLIVCIVVFFLSIAYDKCRIRLLSPITDRLYHFLNVKFKKFFIYE